MRSLLAVLLLSSTLLPVAAHAEPERSLRSAIAERIREGRAERAAEPRSEPVVRTRQADRPAPVVAPPALGRADRPEPRERLRQVLRERGQGVAVQPPAESVRDLRLRDRLERRRQQRSVIAPGAGNPEAVVRGALTDRLRERDALREAERREREARPPVFRDLRDRRALDGFRRDWRRDDRYDWRRHRDRYGSRYHLGYYYDPFGWDYRRWQVGWTMRPTYWSDRYWLNDPWQWRLPAVHGPYRWIRYYDDALLVDVRSGRVVDVIHDFFW